MALLGNARIPLHIDIGFGDAVTPPAQETDLPVLLDLPAPRMQAYPREAVVAEKFEAMVTLGMTNSRMKDFYDIWLLARHFAFEEALLARAVVATFQRRHISLPDDIPTPLPRLERMPCASLRGALDSDACQITPLPIRVEAGYPNERGTPLESVFWSVLGWEESHDEQARLGSWVVVQQLTPLWWTGREWGDPVATSH